ncbi:enterobactin transporter EntS [Yersinia kristensenii]|uniref:Enterobactin exporter EntS n=4 Tax=Yersinia kristensenii TaxID=28152 RepID=A0A0T9L4T9_YERKR|nr:enterobactin transporter EntS [Yersinia kristensenii]MDA5473737.1 enterobactin transporter EntS [Yersinia kristensenii]MDA5507942.1 enterobactin transporter EntS [Yersinia kristensenii]MDA5523619.1 enterobactin transporter EntS [Yersinia kristensenii]MDR4896467.1 enterobactin transporter EntS [Yersinia kristensenii]MDX6734568.1 enterobactin transporter EntS [Yersinia kristensenii]
MAKSPILLDFSLLRENANFRAVFFARFISILGLGMLTVAVPVQIQMMTGSTLQVGLAVTLDGLGMFIGLLLGGVLADRLDRRKLILFARFTCGLGFIGLSINAFSVTPSLWVLYVLAAWDGFFGALGMTALMAATPSLVGRENLAAAGGLSMLTVRFGSVISPAIGGLVIVYGGVGWNYGIAAVGTMLTLLPLLSLPAMKPTTSQHEHPLRALATGISFVLRHKVVGSVVLLGTLVSMIGAIRILFPALAENTYHVGASQIGLMYSVVPLGATIGAFTSGWVNQVRRPGMVLMYSSIGAFLAIGTLGLTNNFYLALPGLLLYGYLGSISGLLQYTLVQTHTPDALLGRVNSLWNVQFVAGESFGALGLGVLAKVMAPALSALTFGMIAATVGGVIAVCGGTLRRATMGDEVSDEGEKADKVGG